MLPAGIAPAWSRLEDGCLRSARPRERLKVVARLGAAPSVCRSGGYAVSAPRFGGTLRAWRSSSQARRIAVFLARVTIVSLESGGLCGHCSRDLPLDRRLLFVAELTGQKWCGVRVMLPTGRRLRCYRPARVFSDLPPHESGTGTWSCTTIRKLMRLPGFSTFPVKERKWWTATASHRALPLAGRVTS